MRTTTRSLVTLLLLLVALAGCSNDGTDDIAAAIEERGAYAAPNASLTQGEVEAIARNVNNAGGRLGVVVLADEPGRGATVLAEDILSLAPSVDDVLVITPEEFGAVSGVVPSINPALIAAGAGFDRGGDAGLVAGYASIRYEVDLTGTDLLAGADDDLPSPGEPTSPLPLLAGLGIVILGAGVYVAARRRRQDGELGMAVEAARVEVREDLTAMADTMLDLDAEVSLADDATRARWAEASGIYSRVRDEVESTYDLAALRDLDEDVELARWQLETVQAELRGTTPPLRPAPLAPVQPPVTQRSLDRLDDIDRQQVVRRQRDRRGGGILGEVLGGLVGGATSGAVRSATRRGGRSRSPTRSRATTRRSSTTRAKGRGGKRK